MLSNCRFASSFVSGLFLCVFLLGGGSAGAQLTVSDYTGCPNQVITVNVSWPNVAISSLSLVIPNNGSATNNGNLQTNTTFTISHPGPGTTNWTLYGTGTGNSGVVTSTVVFQLTIQPPPAINIQNQILYCHGSSATLIADPGGSYYNVTGVQNLGQFQTNVIIVPNLNASHSGTYLVTSVGTCTQFGTTTISVAPNTPITVNTTSNVCEGAQVNLQASLPGATNWRWEYNSAIVAGPGPTDNIYSFVASPSNGGAYFVYADFQWGTPPNQILCPRSASTQVNVVATSPVVVSASPSNMLCQGEKLTLIADAGLATYSWTGPCNFNSTSKSPIINSTIPCHAGIYSVTAYFTNNFVTCTMPGTIQVGVVPTAPPSASVPAAVCENKQVQFTANANIPVQGWLWFGPNFNANIPNPSIDSVKPSNTGPYIVTAVYSQGTKTCGVSSQAQQMTVIQVNSVSVIPSPPVCTPNNAQLASSAPGAVAYDWKGPNNTSYSGANITIYYPTPTVSGIYTVTAYFGSLKCPNSNTVQLTVNPILPFYLEPLHVACHGDTDTIYGPPGADAYSWTSSTGKTGSSQNLILSGIQTKDAGTYTLEVSLGTCKTKDVSKLEVRAPIEFTLRPNSRTICQGDTIFLEVGTNYEVYSVRWSPELYLQAPDLKQQVVVPMGSVQYNIEAWYPGCNYRIGHTFLVEVNQTPTPTLNIRDRACEPLCQLYNTNTNVGSGIITYDFGGIMQYQQQDTIGFYHCLPAGTYTLNVITKDTLGCTGRWQYPYPITVDPLPGADIIWNPFPATTTEDVVFTATAKEPVVYQSWQFVGGEWAVSDTAYVAGGTDTTMDSQPRRRYNQYGKYPVLLISQTEFGCVDSILKVVDVIDVMNVFIPDAFTPNGDGVNDEFSLVGQGLNADGFLFYIFNRKGQLIFSTTDINERWDGTHNGRPCQDGIYTYKIKAVGMNGEGRKEYVGRVALIR